jgi:hypothetical protein
MASAVVVRALLLLLLPPPPLPRLIICCCCCRCCCGLPVPLLLPLPLLRLPHGGGGAASDGLCHVGCRWVRESGALPGGAALQQQRQHYQHTASTIPLSMFGLAPPFVAAAH